MTAFFRKPSEPILDELETATIEAIDTSPSLSLLVQKARRLKHLQVPRRRGPGMVEYGGDFTSRH